MKTFQFKIWHVVKITKQKLTRCKSFNSESDQTDKFNFKIWLEKNLFQSLVFYEKFWYKVWTFPEKSVLQPCFFKKAQKKKSFSLLRKKWVKLLVSRCNFSFEIWFFQKKTGTQNLTLGNFFKTLEAAKNDKLLRIQIQTLLKCYCDYHNHLGSSLHFFHFQFIFCPVKFFNSFLQRLINWFALILSFGRISKIAFCIFFFKSHFFALLGVPSTPLFFGLKLPALCLLSNICPLLTTIFPLNRYLKNV